MIQHVKNLGRAAIIVTLGGCMDGATAPETAHTTDPGLQVSDPEKCFSTEVLPAIVETVTERILVEPEKKSADGTTTVPAVYRSQTSQSIVRQRQSVTFEVPCDAQMTEELLASLQRALKARGYFTGPVSGEMTPTTRIAISRYQETIGLPTSELSMQAARKLGLVAYTREQIASKQFGKN